MPGTIAFVGLGAMGAPVARRLAEAGFALRAFDAVPARVEAVAGVQPAGSIGQAVAGADLLLTCLPSPAAVEAVYADLAQPGLLAADLSTIDPDLARRLADTLAARGMAYVECPMLGGVDQAEAGELYLLLAGDPQACARLAPVLPAIARGWQHVGPSGTASLYKTVQNGLGHVQLIAIAEALAMVERAGADPATFIEVVMAGRGMAASPLFAARAPMMLQPDPPCRGALHIGAKDAALAADLARRLGLGSSLMAAIAEPYARAMAAGLGERDIAAIARIVGQGPTDA